MQTVWNWLSTLGAFAALLAVGIAAGNGQLAHNDAFFLACAIVILSSARELTARSSQSFGDAIYAIAMNPKSFGNSARYVLFIATLIGGVMLTVMEFAADMGVPVAVTAS